MATKEPKTAAPTEADVIEFQWRTELGEIGEDSHSSNPLHRSIAHLFRTGRPFKTLALSFLASHEGCRWFGAFVQGTHLMFFPGLAEEYDRAEMGRHRAISRHSFALDHLTLDLGQRRWHVTSANRAGHMSARRLHDLGDGRALWFAMSFDGPNRLRSLAKITSCRFEAHPSDSARRREIVRQAREGVNFPLMRVPDNPDLGAMTFIHASVIVGPPNFPDYLGEEHAFPSNDLRATPNPTQAVRLVSRVHRLSLSELDLQITLCRLPGQLRMPLAFTSR